MMGVKRGHLLEEIEEIPTEMVDRLHGLSISTAEELISQQASRPDRLASYLEVSPRELRDVVHAAEQYVDSDFVEAVRHHEPLERGLGARSPYSKEFDAVRSRRRAT